VPLFSDVSGTLQTVLTRGNTFSETSATSGNIISITSTPAGASTANVLSINALGGNWSGGSSALEIVSADSSCVLINGNDGSAYKFTVYRSGAVYMSGDLQMTAGGSIVTSLGGDLTLLPDTTGITLIGDAGSPSNLGTPTNDDAFVAGRLETDGIHYADGGVFSAGFVKKQGTAKNADFTITDNSEDVYIVNTGAGAGVTATLPTAADNGGRFLTFVKANADATALTLDGEGAETINGNATNAEMDAQYDTMTIFCNTSEWFIVDKIIA